MTDEYSSKREDALIKAKIAYKEIMKTFDDIEKSLNVEINFCWDECLWVNGEFFQYRDMKED